MLLLALKIFGTLVMAGFAGWGWRYGGSQNGVRWVREVATGISYIACLTIWFGWSWWVILLMGMSFAESTYFKKKGADGRWFNWLACGILYALVPLPFVIAQHLPWTGFIIRSAFIIPTITLWRTFEKDVQWSESGVGVWQMITIPLLMIKF